MKKLRVGLLVAMALCILPATAWAQGKPKAKGKAEAAAEAKPNAAADAKPAAGDAATPPADAAGTGDAAAGEAGTETPGTEAPGTAPGGDSGGLEDICKIDPTACPNLDMNKEAARDLKEQIYAVQQIYALRVRRFEFNPYWSVTLNDQFVGHPAPGATLNYYITNVLGVGLNFNYYRPFNVDSEFNAQVRRAARIAVPLTEYNWSGSLNFTYVLAYGKFAGFSDFIFHYDGYVLGGVGAISTRPIPVIDPDNRNFDFDTKLAGDVGFGLRIFFNRWFAAVFEVRDYIFNDKLENLEVASANPSDKNTWYGDNSLTNNVQFQIGASLFVPFSFDYRLPK